MGRVLDWRPRGRGFESHWRHCVVSLSKNINSSLVLVQPRKTRLPITERLLMGGKESNQTNVSRLTASSDISPDTPFCNNFLLFLKYSITVISCSAELNQKSKEEGKDPELIQSSTTPDLRHHMGK